jgi:hypothetical protein
MLWCLGRPKLLLPAHLLKSIDVEHWRGILAHELAHLRRGDPWVGRIELVAGLIWWWNPLYWFTCRRLDAEAELACDSWVVWALPQERLIYAEALVHVCSEFSRSGSPSPALAVAGSGRFFERRLSMILYERASCRVSPLVLLTVGMLSMIALPSWSFATAGAPIRSRQDATSDQAVSRPHPPDSQVVRHNDDDDDRDSDARDNDADDDDEDAKKSRDDAEEQEQEEKRKPKAEKEDVDVELDLSDIGKRIEAALGPDFEKKIEAWAEKFSKEIEEKFGENSEFVKKMESIGEEMEKKFGEGSEFAKKMEALGKEMEKKFGDQSEFAKKMESLGKEMEKKFGPGSEFEQKIKEKFGPGSEFEQKVKEKLGPGSEFEQKVKEKLGPGSEFEKKMKALGEDMEKKAKHAKELEAAIKAKTKIPSPAARKPDSGHSENKTRTRDQQDRKTRIEALSARIQELLDELKALKEADDHDE